jgi:ribonuclease D
MALSEQFITEPMELAECCSYLASCGRFGFDTEFVGEDSYHPRLCLVQVATAERLILIDPLTVGPLDAFWQLVVDPSIQTIVHAGREEVRLCHLWTGKRPGNLFDLQIAAGLVGLNYPIGHGPLVNQLLNIRLSKAETLTEWRTRPLTNDQIRYAFDDVRYLLLLAERLTERMEALNRKDWVKEECDRLGTIVAPDEPNGERWRKLRGLNSLDRKRLAVVRELYIWREQKAAQTNRPVRALIRDDLIIEIAKRNSSRERDLQVIRGLPKRDLAEIGQVIEQARKLDSEHWPEAIDRDQDPPQVQLVASVITAALGDFCARSHLATSLVASSQEIKQLVRSRYQGQDVPLNLLLSTGWRAAHVLPELLALLEGRRSLIINDVRADTPFAYEEKPK